MNTSVKNIREKVQVLEDTRKIMSKFLNDNCPSQSWLVQNVPNICNSTLQQMLPHGIQFSNTKTAAKDNDKIFKEYNYDFGATVQNHPSSVISNGSEFRCPDILEPKELEELIARGNHKTADAPTTGKILREKITKEVKHGWMFPLSIDTIRDIPGAMIIPLEVATQLAVTKHGTYEESHRYVHDCSFQTESGFSLNDACDMSVIPDNKYGKALLRYLHQIHRARIQFPETPILQCKSDLDAAYRRVHTAPHISIKYISVVDSLAYVEYRLPFGSAPAPALYSILSECIFDLASDLVSNVHWDPSTVHSPHQKFFVKPTFISNNVPYGKAKPLLAPVPLRELFFYGYIDDGLGACVHRDRNLERLQNAVPLSVHTIFRPLSTELLKRADPLSMKKLQGEGQPSERKILLGWEVNTRTFSVHLPAHKFMAWSSDLKHILSEGYSTHSKQKTINGRLTHAFYIFRPGRFFLDRLRELNLRCERYGRQKLSHGELEGVKLWIDFLTAMFTTGVSLNNITYTEYDSACWSDACEHGLGGMTDTGRMFSYEIPNHLRGIFHINFLEFIAARWAIYLSHKTTNSQYCHIAHAGDNTSTVAWLQKSSFNSKSHPEHSAASRDFARFLLKHNVSISNAHKPGAANFIPDILTRDTHIANDVKMLMINVLFPTQTPPSVLFHDLEDNITSELSYYKRLTPNVTASPVSIQRSKVGALLDGSVFSSTEASTIRGLRIRAQQKEQNFSAPLQKACAEINSAARNSLNCELARSLPQCTTFVRPFGRTFGMTLD